MELSKKVVNYPPKACAQADLKLTYGKQKEEQKPEGANIALLMQRYLNICGDITDDGLMWMLRVIKKNLKPARHPDATSVDDHDEGDNFINIEDEEEEIDQVEIDETAINPLNVIAMSSQSSIDSSVVPPKLMGTTITYQFVTAFHNDRVLPPTALPYLDASAPNMTILKNHGHPLQWKLTLNDPDFGQ
ncbi:Callose synthase 9 [Glycine soja]